MTDITQTSPAGAPHPEVPRLDVPHLSCHDVSLHFGGVSALAGVSLSIAAGRITAIMGPNGAGKTTLLNCMSGTIPRYAGTIKLGDVVIDAMAPRQRTQAGLVRTFQMTRVFSSLSIEENIFLAAAAVRKPLSAERCMELIELVRLQRMRHRPAAELSGGQRRLLEIGMCLAQAPLFLMMDEPFAGLNPMMVTIVCEVMDGFARSGAGVVVVSHEIPIVRRHADHVVVMAQGAVLAEGVPEQVLSDPRVTEIYLGGSVAHH
ncbi:ABC transporter ATP-binding protein [Xanthobacter sediminis]